MRHPSSTSKPTAAGAIALLGLLVCATALARTATPKTYVPDVEKNLVGGRKVLLVMPTMLIEPAFPQASGPGTYAGGAGIIVLYGESVAQYNNEVAAAQTLVYPI